MQISMTDFTKFESLIQKGFGGVNDSPNLCRLLTACFAVGIDQIDSVDLAQIETAKKALIFPF